MLDLHWFLMNSTGKFVAFLVLLLSVVGYIGCIIFETKWGGFDD